MKKLLLVLLLMSCANEPIQTADARAKIEQIIVMEPTVTTGTYEEIISSLVITQQDKNPERIYIILPPPYDTFNSYVYLTREEGKADIFGSQWINNNTGYFIQYNYKLKRNTDYWLWFYYQDISVKL